MNQRIQRITSTTTKVRRLGYLVLFSKMLGKSSLSFLSLQQRILNEESIKENRSLLEESCKKHRVRRKGSEIVTGEIRKPDAFKRYLNTASELGLVKEISGRFLNTKRGEILSNLSENKNLFDLSLSQAHFLLKILLDRDYDYIKTTVACSRRNGPDEYRDFFNSIRELWQQKLERTKLRNIETYDELKKALNKKYRSPKRYYRENIRAPILEWFLDLKIIDYWNIAKNRILFRDGVENLLESYENKYSHSFASYMKTLVKGSLVYWPELSWLIRDKLIEDFLRKCFSLFKTREAISKISANQFFEYSVSMLIKDGIVCEIEDLNLGLERLIESKSDSYRYVKIISEVDRGYISQI